MNEHDFFVRSRYEEIFFTPDPFSYLSCRCEGKRWQKIWLRAAQQTPLLEKELVPGQKMEPVEVWQLLRGIGMEDPLSQTDINTVTAKLLHDNGGYQVIRLSDQTLAVWHPDTDLDYVLIGHGGGRQMLEPLDLLKEIINFLWTGDGQVPIRPVWMPVPNGLGTEWLLQRLRIVIAMERERAIKEFNEACAVSDDGAKITRADRVIVVRKDDAPEFPAHHFYERKIRKPAHTKRFHSNRETLIKEAIREIRAGEYDSAYVAAKGSNGGGVFVVRESYVPLLLP